MATDIEGGKEEIREYEGNKVFAGDLRSQGCVLPEEIPDVAWVPAHSVVLSVKPESVQISKDGTMTYDVAMNFTEPFRYATASFFVKKIQG